MKKVSRIQSYIFLPLEVILPSKQWYDTGLGCKSGLCYLHNKSPCSSFSCNTWSYADIKKIKIIYFSGNIPNPKHTSYVKERGR